MGAGSLSLNIDALFVRIVAAMINRAGIIGSGSIALKHRSALEELGLTVALVTGRDVDGVNFKFLADALTQFAPEYIVIASPTARHLEDIKSVIAGGFKGFLLIEKPLLGNPSPVPPISNICAVGYQLRFHPALRALNESLNGRKILSCHAYCGQYLPTWRPARDYRGSYSASRAEGGGVVRDLSHELDYLCWLFGSIEKIQALVGKYSSLEIDTEDTAGILLRFSKCPVTTLQLNYTDRLSRRELTVVTDDDTFICDLKSNSLVSQSRGSERFSTSGPELLKAMHLDVLTNDARNCCSVLDGLVVVRAVADIENAGY